VKEINLISQDTTYFGMDKWEGERPKPRSGVDSSKGESLSTLIRELNKIKGDFWIRLLYTHPAHWSDDLIQAIAESPQSGPLHRHAAAAHQRQHARTS
jgi:ribosomal protein S12 methylthiotransferase